MCSKVVYLLSKVQTARVISLEFCGLGIQNFSLDPTVAMKFIASGEKNLIVLDSSPKIAAGALLLIAHIQC